jgi:hypothetical protein
MGMLHFSIALLADTDIRAPADLSFGTVRPTESVLA